MSGYALYFHHRNNGYRQMLPVLSSDPLHALRRIGNFFSLEDGFGNGFNRFSKVECVNHETGDVHWEFIIK